MVDDGIAWNVDFKEFEDPTYVSNDEVENSLVILANHRTSTAGLCGVIGQWHQNVAKCSESAGQNLLSSAL